MCKKFLNQYLEFTESVFKWSNRVLSRIYRLGEKSRVVEGSLFFSRDHVLTMLHLAPIFANVNRRVTRHV